MTTTRDDTETLRTKAVEALGAHQHLVTPREAALLVRTSVKTLANWRGQTPYPGPPYVRTGQGRGRIMYPLAGLETWLHHRSTATGARRRKRSAA